MGNARRYSRATTVRGVGALMILAGAAWFYHGASTGQLPSLALGAAAIGAGAFVFRRGNRAIQNAIRQMDEQRLPPGASDAERADAWRSGLPQLPQQISLQGKTRYRVRLGPTLASARGEADGHTTVEVQVLADKRFEMWARLCAVLGGDQRRMRQRGLLNLRHTQEFWIAERPVYAVIEAEEAAQSGGRR